MAENTKTDEPLRHESMQDIEQGLVLCFKQYAQSPAESFFGSTGTQFDITAEHFLTRMQAAIRRELRPTVNSEVHQALDSLQASSNMYEDRNFEKEPFYAVCKSDFEAERNKYPLNKETKQ